MIYLTWLLKDTLATRPGPIEAPWDLNELELAGVKAIISLAEQNEAKELKNSNIKHYKFYTLDNPLYTQTEINTFISKISPAIDVIENEISNGNPIMIHCHAGRDRSGALAACYLIKHKNMTAKEALSYIRSFKSYCVYPGYEEAVFYFEKMINKKI